VAPPSVLVRLPRVSFKASPSRVGSFPDCSLLPHLGVFFGHKRLAEREARKAEKLIDGVSFGPDALRVVGLPSKLLGATLPITLRDPAQSRRLGKS
jgi:hypothetical protein